MARAQGLRRQSRASGLASRRGGLAARPAHSTKPRTEVASSMPRPHGKTGGRSSQAPPGLLASQGKDGAQIQTLGPQSWHSPNPTTGKDLMAIRSPEIDITLSLRELRPCILTHIRSKLMQVKHINPLANCHNYYIIRIIAEHVDCPLLTSGTMAFAGCVDLL